MEISDGRGVLVLLEGWDERTQNSPFLDRVIDGQDLPASSVLINHGMLQLKHSTIRWTKESKLLLSPQSKVSNS